jgi:hypothetical protein
MRLVLASAFALILASATGLTTSAGTPGPPQLLERPVIRGSLHAYETLRVGPGT